MQRRFLSILGITLMIALFIPQIIFAEDYDVNEDSYIDEKSTQWDEYLKEMHILDLDVPILGGSGCRNEDSYTFKPANKQLIFYFNDYLAETDNNHLWVTKTCNITVPIKMEEGYQLGIGNVRYQGTAFIPSGGSGKLRREYFFGTNTEKTHTYNIPKKGVDYDFKVDDDGKNYIVWSECGGWVNASIETTVTVLRPRYALREASMNLSSEHAELMFKPVTQACE